MHDIVQAGDRRKNVDRRCQLRLLLFVSSVSRCSVRELHSQREISHVTTCHLAVIRLAEFFIDVSDVRRGLDQSTDHEDKEQLIPNINGRDYTPRGNAHPLESCEEPGRQNLGELQRATADKPEARS